MQNRCHNVEFNRQNSEDMGTTEWQLIGSYLSMQDDDGPLSANLGGIPSGVKWFVRLEAICSFLCFYNRYCVELWFSRQMDWVWFAL